MKIGFYTWGDAQMGMGHVFRCLALARSFRAVMPDARIVFEMKDHAAGVAAVQAAGEQVTCWPHMPDGAWDILVVDQLMVAPDEVATLRRRCRCLVSLDDAGAGHWQADVAINSLYACTAPRPAGSLTRSHFGLEYTLMDAAFARQAFTVRQDMAHVFLTQGGSDTWNCLSRLVEELAPWLACHPGTTLHVHTGPAFEHEESLARALANLPTPWQRHGRVPDLPALMAGMDVAVAAGGVMTFELLAVGVPCLTITAEAKELETTAALARAGLVTDYGAFTEGFGARLRAGLDVLVPAAMRGELSARSRAMLDGLGAERIVALAREHVYAAPQTEEWRS